MDDRILKDEETLRKYLAESEEHAREQTRKDVLHMNRFKLHNSIKTVEAHLNHIIDLASKTGLRVTVEVTNKIVSDRKDPVPQLNIVLYAEMETEK